MGGMVRAPFGHTFVQRIAPAMPVQAYKTYGMSMPPATHWRPATCEEVECQPYLKGWKVRVEGLPEDFLHTARTSGRKYTEVHVAEGETYLVYEAGQPCFKISTHRLPLERPALLTVRGGDWRAATTSVRTHVRAEDWIDDFAEHQDKLATAFQRG